MVVGKLLYIFDIIKTFPSKSEGATTFLAMEKPNNTALTDQLALLQQHTLLVFSTIFGRLIKQMQNIDNYTRFPITRKNASIQRQINTTIIMG